MSSLKADGVAAAAGQVSATRKPVFLLPPLSCDCHAHVFGPQSRFPYHPGRKYTPPEAPLEEYLLMLQAIGAGRGVLVQPTVYKHDNGALLAALERSSPIKLRGVAVTSPGVSEQELLALHEAGVRGLRLNVRDGAELDDAALLAAKIRPLGWHIDLRVSDEHLSGLAGRLQTLPVEIAIAHFGQPEAGTGVNGPAFRSLLEMLGSGRCWIKLSAPMRSSALDFPHNDVLPLIRALVSENPDRLLWGTDWPHTRIRGAIPDDGDLCDLIPEWIPGAAEREKILVKNPAALYGF